MSPFKVVITDFGDPDHSLEAGVLHDSGLDINIVRLQTRDPEELIPQVMDADALIVQWASITRRAIEALSQCKIISRYGIGVDMIDLQAAGEHGIPVANVPDFCIEEVSDATIAFCSTSTAAPSSWTAGCAPAAGDPPAPCPTGRRSVCAARPWASSVWATSAGPRRGRPAALV